MVHSKVFKQYVGIHNNPILREVAENICPHFFQPVSFFTFRNSYFSFSPPIKEHWECPRDFFLLKFLHKNIFSCFWPNLLKDKPLL